MNVNYSKIKKERKKDRKTQYKLNPEKVSRCQNFALTHREYATQCNGVWVCIYICMCVYL